MLRPNLESLASKAGLSVLWGPDPAPNGSDTSDKHPPGCHRITDTTIMVLTIVRANLIPQPVRLPKLKDPKQVTYSLSSEDYRKSMPFRHLEYGIK